MNIVKKTDNSPILDSLWRAYCDAVRAIDALESIGLSVDGDKNRPGSVSSLYGVMTELENAVADIIGAPRDGTVEKIHELMDYGARTAVPGSPMPDTMKNYLNAFPRDMLMVEPGAVSCDVTLAMTGVLKIPARSPEDAEREARRLPSAALLRMAEWCEPEPTDAALSDGDGA